MVTLKTPYLIFLAESTVTLGAQVLLAGDQQTATAQSNTSQQAEKNQSVYAP